MRVKIDLGNGKFEEFDMDENKTMKDHFKDLIEDLYKDLPIDSATKERLKREGLAHAIGLIEEKHKNKLNKTMKELSGL